MISTPTLVLAALLAGSGQTVLLNFHSDSCAPCAAMEPVVRRLASEGFDVRRVDVQQQQQLVRRFHIKQVPTFVAIANGHEVDRVVGPTNYQRLHQMLGATGSPPTPVDHSTARTLEPVPQGAVPASAKSGHPGPGITDQSQQRAMQASVRLRVEDPTGNSFGTGTVIDSRGEEALVITCGHLFRDSSGQGRIHVDLFAPGARNPVPGKLLSYDLKKDVALVAIWPGMAITPVPVAPEDYPIRPGAPVFSIGCDRGADATIRVSQVNSVNKYLGPSNIQVAGQPVIGRSGGGLFSADGQLIGICNLADPQDDEGIYAALPVIHAHVAANLPKGILQRDAPLIAATGATANSASPSRSMPASSLPPSMPRQMPSSPQPLDEGRVRQSNPGMASVPDALATMLQSVDGNTEVICIIRSKDDPNSKGQLIVIDRPTRELLDFLAEEQRTGGARTTVLEAGQPAASIAELPDRSNSSSRGPVLRGQSQ
jgi:thiol-disulfide isomerase/thioredoxin